MTVEHAQRFVRSLAKQWRTRLLIGCVLQALAASIVLGTGLFVFMAWPQSLVVFFSLAAFLSLFVALILIRQACIADVSLMTQHLNRTMPEVEESCGLVLKPESDLTVLEKMQRERVLHFIASLKERVALPNFQLRRSGFLFAGSLGIAFAALLISPSLKSSTENPVLTSNLFLNDGRPASQNERPLKIDKIRIAIQPSAYTGKPSRTINDFDMKIEEGSEVKWRLSVNQRIKSGLLILSEVDTLELNQKSEGVYSAQQKIFDNGFYYFRFDREAKEPVQSDYFRIEVVPDLPPAINVTRPEQKTEIEPGVAARVRIEAEIIDDYGVTATELVATVAQGSGEAVKFRDLKLPFDRIEKNSNRRWILRKNLDLVELGLAPGDELYFYLESFDNREPLENRSRSETFFVTLKDTAAKLISESSGLLINSMPEYFRSQRQIIIDTEKLIQEKASLSEAEFKRRSNNIGLDQQALRFRYGQYLGDEFESEAEFSGETSNEEESENPIEHFMHSHDSAENATLFAPSVKAQLKAALAEMWQAELRLRTYKPSEALPYEYRALSFLKDVQQRSRVYVQRVGFEPPPIKVDEKRLSGDLSSIKQQTMKTQSAAKESYPSIRQALRLLQQLKDYRLNATTADFEILEDAGRELARRAIEEPGRHLRSLQALRELIDDARGNARSCGDCLLSVERTFWKMLPQAEPAPVAKAEAKKSSSLSNSYFNKLGARP